jgi:hypothetical protein
MIDSRIAGPSDPAEGRGYLRFFYRNWRPTRMGRFGAGPLHG